MPEPRPIYFGRAFDLADGTIVLPCEYCGCPAFTPETHTCPASTEAMMAALEQRERDAWRDL